MQVTPIDLTKDLDEVKKVAVSAFGSTPDASLDEWFSFNEMEEQIKKDKGFCLKAVSDEEEIVGILYAQYENPINGKEGMDKWVIVIAAVDPRVEGKGVGSALLRAIEQQARQRNVSKMFVYTNKGDEQVINFYRKNGYEDAGYIKDYQYGKGNSAVFLLKYLKSE